MCGEAYTPPSLSAITTLPHGTRNTFTARHTTSRPCQERVGWRAIVTHARTPTHRVPESFIKLPRSIRFLKRPIIHDDTFFKTLSKTLDSRLIHRSQGRVSLKLPSTTYLPVSRLSCSSLRALLTFHCWVCSGKE